MAKSADDTIPAGAIEVPPNKAIAAAGAAPIGSVVVALILHYFDPQAPAEVVAMWTALANIIISTAAVYMTPHGAVMK